MFRISTFGQFCTPKMEAVGCFTVPHYYGTLCPTDPVSSVWGGGGSGAGPRRWCQPIDARHPWGLPRSLRCPDVRSELGDGQRRQVRPGSVTQTARQER